MKYKTCVQTLLILGLVFACCCILYKANWVYGGSYPSDDYQIELLENNVSHIVNGQKIIILINEMTFNRKKFQLSLRRLQKLSPKKVGQFGENRVLEIE